jgi:outer membrane protein TolC
MDREALWRAASSHPELKKFEAMARSNEAAARRVRADRLPGFAVGVDWIETGGARGAGVQDSGKDPFMVSVSMDLPLWQASYRDEEQAARAEAAAHRADGEAALRDVEAELERALSDVRDADRRIRLYQHTLVPQGETTLSSLRGSYEVGKSTLAQVLMAERRLLDLRDSLAQARADHARAWARLEEIVGQDVPREASEGTHVSPDKPAEGSTQGAGEAAEAASDEGKRDDE